MGRVAEPWAWEERKGWYAWVKGKRTRLASFVEGKREASKRLNRLLDRAELAGSGAAPLVGELAVEYLASLRGRRDRNEVAAQTKGDAERRMAGFAESCGDLPADAIKPKHVEDWLATKTDWGATSRHDGVGAVKSMFRWAMKRGMIDRDPLAVLDKPKRKMRRDAIPATDDTAKVFAAILTPELADLLVFIRETGCRPKEARTMEAKNLDRAGGRVVLRDHKTARKTAKDRVLYLTPLALEIATRLADLRPEGPIFLNSKGNPWTKDALVNAVGRLRKRAGVGKEMVAYALRHGFATEALAREIPAAMVAELMGHSDLRMLATYSHLSDKHDLLRDAVAKIREDKSGT